MGKVFIVTGGKAEGKTSFTTKLAGLLKQDRHFCISGFLSKGYWKNNQRSHYDLINIQNSRSRLLCEAKKTPGWIDGGPYSFDPAAIKKGEEIVAENIRNCQLIILDEIGKLELANKIWHPLLLKLLHKYNTHLLLVARIAFVQEIIEKYELKEAHILKISQTTPESACQLITSSILPES